MHFRICEKPFYSPSQRQQLLCLWSNEREMGISSPTFILFIFNLYSLDNNRVLGREKKEQNADEERKKKLVGTLELSIEKVNLFLKCLIYRALKTRKNVFWRNEREADEFCQTGKIRKIFTSKWTSSNFHILFFRPVLSLCLSRAMKDDKFFPSMCLAAAAADECQQEEKLWKKNISLNNKKFSFFFRGGKTLPKVNEINIFFAKWKIYLFSSAFSPVCCSLLFLLSFFTIKLSRLLNALTNNSPERVCARWIMKNHSE